MYPANPRRRQPVLVLVDIQPEYEKAFGLNRIWQLINFLNKFHRKYASIHWLYNGQETLDMISESDLKNWLLENGLEEDVVPKIDFYDKGYAFFRYCIDSRIAIQEIVELVRQMYQGKIYDSRERTEEFWNRFPFIDIRNLLEFSQDMINVPDLMRYLEKITPPIILTGGAKNECLAEVEIALQALNLNYKIDERWTY